MPSFVRVNSAGPNLCCERRFVAAQSAVLYGVHGPRAKPSGWPVIILADSLVGPKLLSLPGTHPAPLFSHAILRVGGHRVRIDAAGAAPRSPYVRGLSLNGHRFAQPWTTYCTLARGAHLSYTLGRRPKRRWGARGGEQPPSYGPNRPAPANACAE